MTASLTQTNAAALATHATVMSRFCRNFFDHQSSLGMRLLLIIGLALLVHLLVKAIKVVSEWIINRSQAQKNAFNFVTQRPKFITLIQLIASGTTFVICFLALGLVLQEFGVDLTHYLESASIFALAISFGSQGLVQDVVISLTLIFSDAMESGDLVEIAGAVTVVGRVEAIGLRFTTLRNLFNQTVFIPNRTIANVSRFTQDGVFAYADVQVPPAADTAKITSLIENLAQGMQAQFGAIILSQPMIDPVETVPGGDWKFIRVRFKIWPGQGNLIENTFGQYVVRALKTFDPDYANWQVTVTYRAATMAKKL